MRTERALLAILLLLISFVSLNAAELRVVTEPWPPFSIHEGGTELAGMDYEILQEVFKQMGHTLKGEVIPWKRAMQMVEDGQAHILMDCVKTPERTKRFHYPEEPLAAVDIAVFSRIDNPFEYTGINSLKGLTVGIMAGYAYSPEFANSTHFTKEESFNMKASLQKLRWGRVDVVVEQKQAGLYEIAKHRWTGKFHISTTNVNSNEPIYAAFSKAMPGYRQLAKEFSKTLRRFKTTDQYRQILAKYNQPLP